MWFRKDPKKTVSLGKKLKEAQEKNKNKNKKLDIDNENDEEEEIDLLSIVELVTKSTKIDVREIKVDLTKLIENMPTINELKLEIKLLKEELKEANNRNWELINKLVDKPAPTSLATQLAAANRAEQAKAGNNNTAGPKGKLP